MRTAQEYFKELQDEAKVASIAAFVVLVENNLHLAFHKNSSLEMLNSLLERGGRFIAITGIRPTGDLKSNFFLRPLEEFQNEAWIYQQLDELAERIHQSILAGHSSVAVAASSLNLP